MVGLKLGDDVWPHDAEAAMRRERHRPPEGTTLPPPRANRGAEPWVDGWVRCPILRWSMIARAASVANPRRCLLTATTHANHANDPWTVAARRATGLPSCVRASQLSQRSAGRAARHAGSEPEGKL